MSISIKEKLRNIRKTYGNREILSSYNEIIFDTIVDRYRGLSITIVNSNKEFGLNLPDKHIEIDVVKENNERMKYCGTPIRIFIDREGTRKTDPVNMRIICNEVDRKTGSSSLDVEDYIPVNDELIRNPKALFDSDYLIDFLQLLDFYILGKPVSYSYDEEIV